jgi:hypothetical protein
VPMIETVIIEVPGPNHPYGVRGVGEVPIVSPPAALANAICRATRRAGHRPAPDAGPHPRSIGGDLSYGCSVDPLNDAGPDHGAGSRACPGGDHRRGDR